MVKETLSVGYFQRRMRRLHKVTEKSYLIDSARVTLEQYRITRHSIFLRPNLYLVFSASSAATDQIAYTKKNHINLLEQKKVSGILTLQYSCTPVFSYILYGYHPRVTENLQFKDKGRMLEDEKVTLFTRYNVYASTSVSGDICNIFSELEW
jgi:hypothetical protein